MSRKMMSKKWSAWKWVMRQRSTVAGSIRSRRIALTDPFGVSMRSLSSSSAEALRRSWKMDPVPTK